METQRTLCASILILGSALALAWLLSSLGVSATQAPSAASSVIYVNAEAAGPTHDGVSWTTAYTDLQEALETVNPGDEVWIAEGIYTPTNATGRKATFQLQPGVASYGGFAGTETVRDQRDWEAHLTVLSGDLDGNDITDANGVVTNTDNITGTNAYNVVTCNGVSETAVLDGFTITGGRADTFPDNMGGGILIKAGNPTLSNLTFSGNYAQHGGGIHNDVDSPTLTNITFIGNKATFGGGIHNRIGSPTLTNVTFSGNEASFGGGMYNWQDTRPTLINVTFSGNEAGGGGGGVCNWHSIPTLINVTFSGNEGGYGGGLHNAYSDSTLTNVTFSGNSALHGGGIYNTHSNPRLTNVTLSGNHASEDGGGIHNSIGSPTLTNVTFSGNKAHFGGGIYNKLSNVPMLANCILWGNGDQSGTDETSQIHNVSSVITVTYSLVQGGVYTGTGNISENPLFVAPITYTAAPTTGGNYRLQAGSPAIDAGDNGAVPADTHDLDGDGNTAEKIPADLGGNPRLVNNPDIADTGHGTAPIVDMGAYEEQSGASCSVYLPIVMK